MQTVIAQQIFLRQPAAGPQSIRPPGSEGNEFGALMPTDSALRDSPDKAADLGLPEAGLSFVQVQGAVVLPLTMVSGMTVNLEGAVGGSATEPPPLPTSETAAPIVVGNGAMFDGLLADSQLPVARRDAVDTAVTTASLAALADRLQRQMTESADLAEQKTSGQATGLDDLISNILSKATGQEKDTVPGAKETRPLSGPDDLALLTPRGAKGIGEPSAAEVPAFLRLWQGIFLADRADRDESATVAAGRLEEAIDLPALATVATALPAKTRIGPTVASTVLTQFADLSSDLALDDTDPSQALLGRWDSLPPGPLGSHHFGNAGPNAPISIAAPQLAAQLGPLLAARGDGSIELALSPDELGHVRVTMQADATNPDRMIVMLNFERPETLDLFRRHADLLAEALKDAGYAGADLNFGQSGAGGWGDAPAETGAETGLGADASARFDAPTRPGQEDSARALAGLALSGSLDLRM
jgi:Flagellar hook-length control protein FliK